MISSMNMRCCFVLEVSYTKERSYLAIYLCRLNVRVKSADRGFSLHILNNAVVIQNIDHYIRSAATNILELSALMAKRKPKLENGNRNTSDFKSVTKNTSVIPACDKTVCGCPLRIITYHTLSYRASVELLL